jgi:hypothetical protein
MGHTAIHTPRLRIAIALLACLVVGGCGAMSAPADANAERTGPVSVNRTNKGDRLPSVATANLFAHGVPSSTALSTPRRPPLGCDPAFSPIADPARAGIYKRCAA